MGFLDFLTKKKDIGVRLPEADEWENNNMSNSKGDNYKHTNTYVTELASNNKVDLTKSTDGSKGMVQQIEVSFPKELGDQHPFDFTVAEGLYRAFPMVFGIIDKFVDFVLGPGITVASENEKAQIIIEAWIQDIDFNSILKAWLREALMKGTGFLEVGGVNDSISILKPLDAQWMYIKRDKFGLIEGYNQFIGGINKFKQDKVTHFEADEIIHLPINVVGDSAYGIGVLSPLFKHVDTIVFLEKIMNRIMERKANTPIHWKVGFISAFWRSLPKPAILAKIRNRLTNMKADTEFVTGPDHEAKVIDFGDLMKNFEIPLRHNIEQMFYGSQIPEVLYGAGNIAEGLAVEQRKALDARVRSMQIDIEKVIERQIFRKILQSNNIDDHVEIIWGAPSDDQINAEIASITELLKNPLIDAALSLELQKKLAELFKFPDDTLPKEPVTDDDRNEQEREGEEEASQPVIPGGNRVKNLMKQDIQLEYGYLEDDKDYSIKEWLGFNFNDYQDSINDMIDKDNFEALAAQTQDQIEAGLLTTPQIIKLKSVLDEGFNKEKSINEISDDIDNLVKPGDRFQLSKSGALVLNKDGQKILRVSANVRGKLIARTEISRIANLGAIENYKDAEVEKYKWVATSSDRTCPICIALDGEIFVVGSASQKLPPTASHNMCRCTVVPIVELKGKSNITE